MKILAIADVHGDIAKTKRLVKMMDSINPDVIVLAGDITQFGPRESAKDVLGELEKSKKQVLAIIGNNDTTDVREELKEKGIDMHNKALEMEGVGFVGFQGPQAMSLGGMRILNYDPIHYKLKDIKKCDQRVMISHVPPAETKADVLFTGQHVGSDFLRETIEDEEPDLLICGHIHEARSVDKIGNTTVVNTGALCEGYAAIINLQGRTSDVEFLRIE